MRDVRIIESAKGHSMEKAGGVHLLLRWSVVGLDRLEWQNRYSSLPNIEVSCADVTADQPHGSFGYLFSRLVDIVPRAGNTKRLNWLSQMAYVGQRTKFRDIYGGGRGGTVVRGSPSLTCRPLDV